MPLDKKINEEEKGRRIIIDLTPSAAAEIDRLKEITKLNTPDLYRCSMSLLRILVNAYESGSKVYLQKSGELVEEIKKPY